MTDEYGARPELLPHDEGKSSSGRSGLVTPLIVPKPWGHEEWIIQNTRYVLKLLYVNKGESLSLQYHEQKMETLRLLSGRCKINMEIPCEEGSVPLEFILDAEEKLGIHINPRTVHRFEALEDSLFLEGSTPEVYDVVRLEDRYGRPATDAKIPRIEG